jgi:hypothetical protein
VRIIISSFLFLICGCIPAGNTIDSFRLDDAKISSGEEILLAEKISLVAGLVLKNTSNDLSFRQKQLGMYAFHGEDSDTIIDFYKVEGGPIVLVTDAKYGRTEVSQQRAKKISLLLNGGYLLK